MIGNHKIFSFFDISLLVLVIDLGTLFPIVCFLLVVSVDDPISMIPHRPWHNDVEKVMRCLQCCRMALEEAEFDIHEIGNRERMRELTYKSGD